MTARPWTRPRWVATMATVSGLVPIAPVPGMDAGLAGDLAGRLRHAVEREDAAGQVDDPDEDGQEDDDRERELDQALARAARAARPHGVTVTVRVRVSFPPKFETTRVIV